ncbi:hypothetical protein A6V39_00255 [Candidatus Mycoplasma haematobovis]|uniref:Uncharacterized protein n=1 Tax=Candidatus Mycoplasma haematobovis TaxID=432608 RepID=A0A1A9QEP4_9MOLU|nr:hypothetical protein [Candidatus Mycoplasma haematobovis]OAL10481.1 hypothetical protein A6V39_00255 [Candidatus Mycoplasma haematobovis]
MITKLVVASIIGTSAIGGASVGCYYCFKSKAPESSQSTSSTKGQVTKDINSNSLQTSLAPEGSAGSRTTQDPPATTSAPQISASGVNSEPETVSPTQ